MMTYRGAAKINPSAQSVVIAYDADCKEYTYTNVVYTNGAISYKGNYYNGQWTLSNCTERVQEFFDFYTDYRKGDFDSGSFLRFTELNNLLNSYEFDKFMDTVRSRLSTDSPVATITSSREGDTAVYHYDLNVKELFELIRNQGASIFYTSPDYNNFVARLNANSENIDKASGSLDFTVNGSGYMSSLALRIDTGSDTYDIRAKMDNFGSAEPDVPDAFYEEAGIQKPR